MPAYVDAADGRVFCLAPPWPPAAAVPDGYLDDGIDYDPYDGGGAVADAGNYSRRLSTAVELSTNGVDFTASGLNFTYHAPPRLTALEPTVGPSAGDTDVVIHGDFGDAPAWGAGSATRGRRRQIADARRAAPARARCGACRPPRSRRTRWRPAGDACQFSFEAHEAGKLNPKGEKQKYETYGDAAANGKMRLTINGGKTMGAVTVDAGVHRRASRRAQFDSKSMATVAPPPSTGRSTAAARASSRSARRPSRRPEWGLR